MKSSIFMILVFLALFASFTGSTILNNASKNSSQLASVLSDELGQLKNTLPTEQIVSKNSPQLVSVVSDELGQLKNALPTEQKELSPKCRGAISAQQGYLDQEKLSEQFTFDKYRVSEASFTPADLDIASNRFAREFRTMLRDDLAEEGVNFAGHYSIVSVGMTGWAENYWIVDRRIGRAYTFPYTGYGLDFRADSNLIILDSKDLLRKMWSEDIACLWLGMDFDVHYFDLKPFYFLWENNELKFLGPKNIEPIINKFWTEFAF